MNGQGNGVTALVQQAEEREIATYFERARRIEINRAEAIDCLDKMARSKVWWLRSHGPKRPATDVEVQERHLAVLVHVLDTLKRKQGEGNAPDRVG